MQPPHFSWYTARTKPKHEHIAAANLRKNLGLEVFLPRLRLEKLTRRGLVRVMEPLFPCYIFTRCVIEERMNEIQHTSGVNRLVHFGGKIPAVPDSVVAELQESFRGEEVIVCESRFAPGDEVTVATGAFAGFSAQVLKNLSARKRVQILLDILGRQTVVEVESDVIIQTHKTLADLVPGLAAVEGGGGE